jgi:hypothetical protein
MIPNRFIRTSRSFAVLVALLAPLVISMLAGAKSRDSDSAWVTTWGASPVAPLPANSTNPGFTNQTVRMIVHTSVGGGEVRVRLSNLFGTDSLVIGAAHIALRS